MPVEVLKCTGGSFYVPMDGPWQSEEDNDAYKAALDKYNELVESNTPYVVLIKSHDEFTHGYWIELWQKPIKFPDHILKEHNACV